MVLTGIGPVVEKVVLQLVLEGGDLGAFRAAVRRLRPLLGLDHLVVGLVQRRLEVGGGTAVASGGRRQRGRGQEGEQEVQV